MRLRNANGCYRCMLGLLGLLVLAHPTAQAKSEFDGQVELLYRSVNVDGSSSKYEEDFNGLDSGVRLGQFQMNWQDVGSSFLDYARLNFTGLGGEPFEYSSLTIGRKDVYDLRFTSRKQDYLYNLFQVTDDEDGHSWNTERRMTKIDLSFYVTEKVDILVKYDEVTRTGNSLFMKDIQRDLFRLETPIDQNVKRFSAGFRVKTGRNRVFFLQTLRRYDYIFDNFTEGNEGLNTGDPAILTNYAWRQNDDGTANLSTLRWDSAWGSRVNLSVGYFGTLFGEEEIESRVDLDADGTDFAGAPFMINGAFNDVTIKRDVNVGDVDLSIKIINPLTLHLQYRDVSEDTKTDGVTDLDGDGVTAPISTEFEHTYDIATAILEYRPLSSLTFRGGYRAIDRELERAGFISQERNVDFESSGDKTIIFGFDWRPHRVFRLTGDHQNGDVKRPFTAVSLFESNWTRVRATIKPTPKMSLGLSYKDFENKNTALTFNSEAEGQTGAVTWTHNPTERVSYSLSYTRQDIDTATMILFDTAAFGGTEDGDTFLNTDNESAMVRVEFSITAAWKGFFRAYATEVDGNNPFVGDVSGLISQGILNQDFVEAELGVTYDFPSGLYLGGSLRYAEYSSTESIQTFSGAFDYDANIITFLAGVRF